MELSVYMHTAIAISCMVACYFWGRYFAKGEILAAAIATMLERLEQDDFVRMTVDEDGEKSLIRISEIEIKIMNEMR